MSGFITKIPDENKYHEFVLQCHGTGKAVHLDLRCQIESNLLDGLTLPIKGKQFPHEAEGYTDFTQMVKTIVLPRIKSRVASHDNWLAIPKKKHPKEWLHANGTIKAGELGASGRDWYIKIIDKGRVEYGAIKPYSKELFFHGKIFKGRFVTNRVLNRPNYEKTGSKKYLYLLSKTKEEMPYVLGNGAVKDGWLPPLGVSALPEVWRRRAGKRYPYWLQKSKAKAVEMRDELVDSIKKNRLEIRQYSGLTAGQKSKELNDLLYERYKPKLGTDIIQDRLVTTVGSTTPIEVLESKLSAKEGRYLWEGVPIREGVWSGHGLSIFWTREALWESIPLIIGTQVTYRSHSGEKVGEVVGASKILDGIRAWGWSDKDLTGYGLSVGTIHLVDLITRILFKILEYTEVAAVKSPACKLCYVEKPKGGMN